MRYEAVIISKLRSRTGIWTKSLRHSWLLQRRGQRTRPAKTKVFELPQGAREAAINTLDHYEPFWGPTRGNARCGRSNYRGKQSNRRLQLHEIYKEKKTFNEIFQDNYKKYSIRVYSGQNIDYIQGKCFKAPTLLRYLAHLKWGSYRVVLLRLCRSLVRSKLDYGWQIYASALRRILNKLNAVHNEALQICSGAFRSSPIVSLYVEACEPSLELRRMKIGLQHYIKAMNTAWSIIVTWWTYTQVAPSRRWEQDALR